MFFPVLSYGYVQSTALVVANASDAATLYTAAIAWDESTGFGASYAGPSPASASACTGARWSGLGNAVLVAAKNSPYCYAWAWSSGWSTKYSDPASPPLGSYPNGCDINDAKTAFILGGNGSPYISATHFSEVTGWGANYSNPGTLPANACQRLMFHPDGDYIIAGMDTSSPFVIAYEWDDSTGFGTKLSDPSTVPTENAIGANFDLTGTKALLFGGNPTYYLYVYNWSGGFGSKYSDPTSLPTRTVYEARMTRDRGAIVSAQPGPGFAQAWNWSDISGFGAKYSAPSTPPDQNCWSCYISGSGENVVIGKNATASHPCMVVYPWTDAGGWGTKWANMSPTTGYDGAAWNVAFNGSGL